MCRYDKTSLMSERYAFWVNLNSILFSLERVDHLYGLIYQIN